MKSAPFLSRRNLRFLLPFAFLLPVFAHIYNSRFTRMMADDYCFANIALQKGLWGALDYWYNNWSGRHSATLVQSAITLMGTSAIALLPSVLLVSWLIAMIWGIYQIYLLLGWNYKISHSILFGTLSLYGVVGGLPNAYQAIYWTSGSLAYTAPIVAATFYINFLLYVIRRKSSGVGLLMLIVTSGIITFIVGGFSETTVVLESFILILALGWCWFQVHSSARYIAVGLLLAGLAGALMALVVTLSAPGNLIRESGFNASHSIMQIGLLSLQNAASFVAIQIAYFSLTPILVCLTLSALIAAAYQPFTLNSPIGFKRSLQIMGAMTVVGFILIIVCFAPAAYGMGKMPAARAWVVPQMILILTAVAWGFTIGLSLRSDTTRLPLTARLILGAGILLMIAGPIQLTGQLLAQTPALMTYAAEWDAQNRQLREAAASGATNAVISPLSVDMARFAGLDRIGDGETGNYHVCMQQFYRLESITIAQTAQAAQGN